MKLPGVWVCLPCSPLARRCPAHSWVHQSSAQGSHEWHRPAWPAELPSPRPAPLLMEVSMKRAGSKGWPRFSLRSCFLATLQPQCVCDADPGLPPHLAPWGRGRSSHLPESPSAPGSCPLQSSQPCCTLSATDSLVGLGSRPVHTHLLEAGICIKVLCVLLTACKAPRVMIVRRSWLPLTLGSSSSDLAGTNSHPGYLHKGNNQSHTHELLSLFGQVTNWRLCEVNTHSDKLLLWCQSPAWTYCQGGPSSLHLRVLGLRQEATFPLLRGELTHNHQTSELGQHFPMYSQHVIGCKQSGEKVRVIWCG